MEVKGFIVMGVSGSGKSTVAQLLANRLGWTYLEADNFHSPENIAKMEAGIPLNDTDRAPWLSKLNKTLSATLQAGGHPVLACSALKASYRKSLTWDNAGLLFVYLKGDYELIWSRLSGRRGHYMKPGMLRSQFETLEEPVNALVIETALSHEEIVESIIEVAL